jgi:hypothetical protein
MSQPYFVGEEKANLVDHSLNMLQDIGIIVAGVTCDGPSSNFAMFSKLGASISPGSSCHFLDKKLFYNYFIIFL